MGSENLRLVIFDYPIYQLDNSKAMEVLKDIIVAKQRAFSRTSNSFITMGPLDMISNHALVYDTTDLFAPKLIFAMRLCLEHRARKFNVDLPVDGYKTAMPPEAQLILEEFRRDRRGLADANAWFVDPDFGYAKSGLRLAEIGFFSLITWTLRCGYDNMLGITNERYKASRWTTQIGDLVSEFTFEHPVVKDPHRFVLAKNFSGTWLQELNEAFKEVIDNRVELAAPEERSGEQIRSLEDIIADLTGGRLQDVA